MYSHLSSFYYYLNVSVQLSSVTQLCPTLCDPMDYTQSMEFSRPEYWSGLLFPSPEDLPNPGIEHRSPAFQEDSLPAEPPGKPLFACAGPYCRHAGSLAASCRIQFPDQGSNLGPLHWEHSLSHWTAREVPWFQFKAHQFYKSSSHQILKQIKVCFYNTNKAKFLIILRKSYFRKFGWCRNTDS